MVTPSLGLGLDVHVVLKRIRVLLTTIVECCLLSLDSAVLDVRMATV